MTQVRFYHLQRQSQAQVLPVLLHKALERGHRILVKLSDATEVSQMNDYLWTYDPNSFLPHGNAGNGFADKQPIFLTCKDENPNNADVLILGQGAEAEDLDGFSLCCDLLNGHDASDVNAARARWKRYKESEYDITYWQQDDRGAWAQKA
ncbi:MAG: DNA polymerase III subunit chi [Alphaproteobacteria bacterium]